jgi:hypothetical protein
VKEDYQARDENDDVLDTNIDYRFVLHTAGAGYTIRSNPVSVPTAVADSPAFMADLHYGPRTDG